PLPPMDAQRPMCARWSGPCSKCKRVGNQCQHDAFTMLMVGNLRNKHVMLAASLNSEGKLLPNEKRAVYVQYAKSCVAERRTETRGALEVMELFFVVTANNWTIVERNAQ
ncbi:MAG: hypothetical protein ACKPKO_28015, partial [Candidatus Fonsibacter sp.]